MATIPRSVQTLPTPVSASAFSDTGLLGIASEDGTIRFYEGPSYGRVWKGLRVGGEVASITFQAGEESQVVWVACEQHVSVMDVFYRR